MQNPEHSLYDPPIDGHFGVFRILTVVGHAVVIATVQVSLSDRVFIFLRYVPRSRIAGRVDLKNARHEEKNQTKLVTNHVRR